MTRMERLNDNVAKQKKARLKWLLLLVFISSTLLFYRFGPDLIMWFIEPAREKEEVNLIQKGRPGNIHLVMEEGVTNAFNPGMTESFP